jgi:hypothetical protein
MALFRLYNRAVKNGGNMVRYILSGCVVAVALMANPASVRAQQPSDSDYITKVTAAAPPAVVKSATIVQMQKDGSVRIVQTGSNGFTCMMLDPTTPMCADKNAMAWAQALAKHVTPPNSVGFVYMLAGDNGTSNTNPYDTAATANNHWVKTGAHVMIVGPAVATMGYPMSADADPTKPYVMWANTPYAHLMIPVAQP